MAFRSTGKKAKRRSSLQLTGRHCATLAATALLLLLCFVQLQTALLEQIAFSGTTAAGQLTRLQHNPKVLYRLGINEYLLNSDNEQALYYFTKAINTLSLYIPAFLRKGEILAEEGKTEQAQAISTYVDTIAPDSYQWRWDRTMLAYSLDQHDLLAENLSWFIANNLGKRKQALAIATTLWPDPHELVTYVGVKNSPHILHYFIKMKELEKAQTTWQIVYDHNLTDETNTRWYTNFLIRHNKIDGALQSWKYVGPPHNDDNRIINHDFEGEIIGSGFGWRLKRDQRKLLSVDGKELHITFAGNTNVRFMLHQLIPVSPGETYSLSFSQKSESLTTDQRPFWTVQSFKCEEKLWNTTAMAKRSSEWQGQELTFQVPRECKALRLALRRKKSFHFDNKITGTYAVRDITLRQTPDTLATMVQ